MRPNTSLQGVERRRELRIIELVSTLLQRLFSTFPGGWPGAGLLLFRLCLGAILIGFGTSSPQGISEIVCGILLFVGLWTPALGVLTAFVEALIALSLYRAGRPETWQHIPVAILSISIAMLGPGAWSVDARLFGRKRFDIDRARTGNHPPKG